jgi:hypothetical protein
MFAGALPQHLHEDNAMLLRWEIDDGECSFLRPPADPDPDAAG